MPRSALALIVCALLFFAATPTAPAQCFGPDNLDIGPCCAQAVPNLPSFPSVSVPGLGICWSNCVVSSQRNLQVDWQTPTQPFCGEYTTSLLVTDVTSGLPVLTGTLVLDYTRTWVEIDTAGNPQQVWRFTAKADLGPALVGVVPTCPWPNCIAPVGPYPTAFFYGYADYTACNAAGGFQNALVLYHACDRFIHMAALSDRPGVFHPGDSFAIVAPHSATQPFIPMNSLAPGGPLLAEATRPVNNVAPPICTVEDRIVSGALTPLGAGCICTLTKFPKYQTLRQFAGKTACVNAAGLPGDFTSLNVNFPALPWLHLVSSSIGAWSNPNVYPGKEAAWVDEGLFIQHDSCTGDVVEVKYGGSTKGGWTVLSPLLFDGFTDIADNYTAPLFGPYPLPVVGSIQPTDRLIYVNVP